MAGREKSLSRLEKLRWLLTGFVGTLVLMTIAVVIFIWKLTPLISIDEKNGDVKILGGLIEISDNEEMHFSWSNNSALTNGSKVIDTHLVKNLRIEVRNGVIELSSSEGEELSWSCRGDLDEDFIHQEGDAVVIGGQSLANASCTFSIPSKLKVQLAADNGKITLNEPRFDVDANAQNGKFHIVPAGNVKYKFLLHAVNGKVDKFDSSEEAGAVRISVNVKNGLISKG